ncbi:MAG TPA: FxSxx-COOH system tetratricopeptide repeat protein [Candidatus Eremiobacteraceae bacterium]|nr:FxSxx-COOH system tetratricopeptide repeat protein [Candidatus Eremiobacteraceae bacterium]
MELKAPLPSGTVTFAFTDIEGSTARWERDRAAMQEAVRRHDSILREAIEKRGGHVFKTMGDAFFSVFTRPEDAIAAMLAAQRAILAEDFSAIDGLRVRAAMHTGTADEREGDYFGPALNKVARLLSIGHGGQILLTSETMALAEATLPADIRLTDLGAYHLKDIIEPQRVYQILSPGLPEEFPPLRSLGILPSDLSLVDAAEFHSVPSFSGRDDELAVIDAALQHENAVAVVLGLGGVGKSSIAREYGWRNRDKYSVLWWLDAQTEDGIIDGLLRLGIMFVKGLDQLADRRAGAQRVINSVLGGFDKPVLLVFDNLEDDRLMRSWLPRSGTRALATSRDTALSSDIIAIPLQTWSTETAVAYLQHASGRTDLTGTDARSIAEALGALPLAMAHAASSLRNQRMLSPGRYLERINEHLKKAPRTAEYPRSVFATFSEAIAQAEQQAPGAAAVLCFATLFAPDDIPDELFRQRADDCPEGLRPVLGAANALDLRSMFVDDLRLDEALGALDRLSLITFSSRSRTYSMHRLIQRAGTELIGPDPRRWRELAAHAAYLAYPEAKFTTWAQCERVLPHARAVLDSIPNDSDLLDVANLADRCGEYLRDRAEYATAEALSMRALTIREKVLGSNHLDVAVSLSNLATAIWHQGRYAESAPLCARALEIREKVHGPEHLDVAGALNRLAVVSQELGHYRDAEALHKRALAIREKALGLDHPEVAVTLNNLANVYAVQGRFAEAEPLHVRALAIRVKAQGPDHPNVAYSTDNLANVYGDLGRHAESETLHKRALAIWEKALGPDHPDVALSVDNLADSYAGQHRYAEAETLHKRALAIWEKALGADHPRVANSLHSLAMIYRDLDRHKEGEPLLFRALSIRERALGSDHPLTKYTREALDGFSSEKTD